jgi:hypothetical protein
MELPLKERMLPPEGARPREEPMLRTGALLLMEGAELRDGELKPWFDTWLRAGV